ncbi:MAG: hypothetical protein EP329_01035 [Deltaproteobacteria bacterium]|nr:MAG: hypothetical protein EP329_01035 [Deltaproteobacteria bacterium]
MSYRVTLTSLMLCVTFAASGCSRSEDAAPATGEAPMMGAGLSGREAAADLWMKLASYKESFLASWDEGAFDTPKPRAITVLKAFAQVADQVTGPTGFWRDKVPNDLLACHSNPDDQVCEGLEQAWSDFAEWDDLVRDIERLDATRADVFLARNHERMLTYLATFVPAQADAAAMKQTAFFDQRLKKYVAKQ